MGYSRLRASMVYSARMADEVSLIFSVFNTGILYRSPPSYQTRSEQGPALNEAELITEWIGAVKAALAPRLGLDGLQHASSRLRAHVPEVFFEVVD